MNGDEDLGQNIIMKGDKYHYNQRMSLGQYPSVPAAEPGAPPYWKAYEERQNIPDEEPKEEFLPRCTGAFGTGEVPGITCARWITSTPPGHPEKYQGFTLN